MEKTIKNTQETIMEKDSKYTQGTCTNIFYCSTHEMNIDLTSDNSDIAAAQANALLM